MTDTTPYLLILYYSRNGQTAEMATQIGRGVARVPGIEAPHTYLRDLDETSVNTVGGGSDMLGIAMLQPMVEGWL